MKKMTNLMFGALALLFSCADAQSGKEEGLFADIQTNKGTITVELEYKKTPITVANFISLAEGTNPHVKPEYKGKRFYDGLKFHRVISDFMIQGGCPLSNGTGDPGYRFKDEVNTGLKHHRAGTLSMANSGPNTNGSQFFITHKDTPWLDNKHTVFGYVTKGQDVVNSIKQNDVIEKITIIRKGKDAERFDAKKIFSDYFVKDQQKAIEDAAKKAKLSAEKKDYYQNLRAKASKTQSGLEYVVIEKGNGVKPAQDQQIYVDYSGYLVSGILFDTSSAETAKDNGVYNEQRDMQGGYKPFPYTLSNKNGLIPGFLEGLEKLNIGDKAVLFIPPHLGYGERGAGGVIPPNAELIFEVQILDKIN